jgi:hypothetical protein
MIKVLKLSPLLASLFSAVVAASAQESDEDWKKELSQEAPEQAKKEAQKPDTKASAGDLAKATQNPVAGLVSVPIQNITDFNIDPFGRDRNIVLQFQPVVPIQLSTGAPTILLMPVNMMRSKNDPTGFDVPVLSRNKEAKVFGDLNDFHFEDGHTFDFRGESIRSAEGRGGTLSDSNQRATKGFSVPLCDGQNVWRLGGAVQARLVLRKRIRR